MVYPGSGPWPAIVVTAVSYFRILFRPRGGANFLAFLRAFSGSCGAETCWSPLFGVFGLSGFRLGGDFPTHPDRTRWALAKETARNAGSYRRCRRAGLHVAHYTARGVPFLPRILPRKDLWGRRGALSGQTKRINHAWQRRTYNRVR